MRCINFFKRYIPHPLKYAYYIGFVRKNEISLSIEDRYARVRWINVEKYKNEGWFADPFIVSVNGNIIELFAEEMIYKTGRGVIVYLKIDLPSREIIEKKTLLELETHLSYPIYIRDNGKLYVYPENYQSGALKIYEYDESSGRLVHPQTIINAPLLDTQIVKIEESYYALGVMYQTGLQKDTKRLNIYKANTLFGDYKLIQVIDNARCEERGAGLCFKIDNQLIRPAQCCEGGYGKEVILYELKKCNSGFEEIEINRIIPDRKAKNGNVLHTYNEMNGWIAIDGWSYQYPYLASYYKKIRKIDSE